MRKYLRNITVGAALLLLAGSCTDKFEEYNTNQYQIHDADPVSYTHLINKKTPKDP